MRAQTLARSIVASAKIEGQSLSAQQTHLVAAVIDGQIDAETAIREFRPSSARRVHKSR